MKNLLFRQIFSPIFFVLLSIQSMGQYVTLSGRQFKDGSGNDYYPLVCNYAMQIAYNGSYTGFSSCYLTPCNSYGEGYPGGGGLPLPNYDYDYDTPAGALLHLQNDFAQIKDMGFNAIRTAEIGPIKDDFSSTGAIGFRIETHENAHPIWTQTTYSESISPTPYAYNDPLNANVQKLFSFYQTIFTEAGNAGLKVLLDVAYGDLCRDAGNIDRDDYILYLEALADHFKNEPALMAYVIIEEPSFLSQGHDNTGHTKQQVCEITTSWYDAIKSKDTNHLITMGGTYVLDAMEWDPGVMKLDFYCPHVYPSTYDYESYDVNKAFDRMMGNLIWLENNSPMPWMIGETGFSAYDDCYYFSSTPSYVAPSPGGTNGTVTQQRTYAENALDAVRNTKGSGFSWWNYQENWWGASWVNEDGLGLLRHGPGDPSSEKPATQAFRNYTFPGPAAYTTPSNYYYPFNTGTSGSYNTSGTNAISGYVEDSNTGSPIKDAVVFGYNWLETVGGLNPYHYSVIYTFSNGSGYYNLAPYNYLTPSILNPDRIVHIKLSATGAERFDVGSPWPNDWKDFQMPLPPNAILNRSDIDYNAVVQNIVVNPLTKKFRGYNALSVSNNVTVSSGTISDFSARNEVDISSEVHISSGSETHIFLADFQDCYYYNAYNKYFNTSEGPENDPLNNVEKLIELNFDPIKDSLIIQIRPNPNEGVFSVEFSSRNSSQDINLKVTIYDALGNSIYKDEKQDKIFSIDLREYPPGIYLIQLSNQSEVLFKKFVIN